MAGGNIALASEAWEKYIFDCQEGVSVRKSRKEQ